MANIQIQTEANKKEKTPQNSTKEEFFLDFKILILAISNLIYYKKYKIFLINKASVLLMKLHKIKNLHVILLFNFLLFCYFNFIVFRFNIC